jgi:acylphosphatase
MNTEFSIQYNVKISGQVQGVFFRKYSQEKAQELKITGWVKNLQSGNVEMCIQGKHDHCQEMIKWCHKGSPFSHVSSVLPKKEKLKLLYDEFNIEE